jgi:hypothetical protein
MAKVKRLTRGVTMLAAASVVGFTAFAGAAYASAVEGNCMASVTPTATGPVDTTTTTITVTWTDACTNLDYYNIEVSTDAGVTWSQVGNHVAPASTTTTGPTSNNGSFAYSPVDCGAYTFRVIAVHDVSPTAHVSISSDTASVTLTTETSSCTDSGPTGQGGDCTQLTGALTLGYYSNKNGQKTVTADDLSMLAGLNLVDAGGNGFNPTTAAQLKTWLLNATAKNMSYMLSAQLATLELNVAHVVGADKEVCEANNETIGDIANDANTYLGAHSSVLGGDVNRPSGDALETLIDEINNNLVSVV